MRRQAMLVCVVCALAVLLTAGITVTLLKRGKPAETPETPASSEAAASTESLAGYYRIDEGSSALLAETADAGEDYLSETLFIGDSNTVRLYNNGLISLQQFCAKEGIGTQAALNDGIVTFKNDDTHYTIAQAVAMMKPRRVVITLGTNDNGMATSDFIANYTKLVQAIQAAYPYTDIIVNTVPPIPANHSTYPNMDQAKVDDFNMALLTMCEQLGVHFLNSAEVLKDETGYGKADYYTSGDIHLKNGGLKAVLSYLRTHAYETADRRPDTGNIPTRTLEYSANPSDAVAAPSSESGQAAVQYEARYQVEKSGGGTLSCGSSSGETSLVYSITDAGQELSVTAVPADGYVFVKWSDGVTSKTRTDTNFKQNVDVTAVFAAASVQISYESHGFFSQSYTFKATVKSKYATSDTLRWYANGEEITEAAGMTSVNVDASMMHESSYKIYAVVSYNGCTVTSNTLTLTVSGGVEPEVPSSSSTSSSSSSSSASTGTASSSGSSSTSSSQSTAQSSSTAANGTGATPAPTASSHSASSGSSSSSSSSSSGSSSAESKQEASSSSHSSSAAVSSSSSSTATEQGGGNSAAAAAIAGAIKEAAASRDNTNEAGQAE